MSGQQYLRTPLEELTPEEVLEKAKEFLELVKERDKMMLQMQEGWRLFQTQIREAKSRAWAAKKELKALKKAQMAKSSGETTEKNTEVSSVEVEVLKKEIEELQRKNKELKQSNSDMNERMVKVLRVSRNTTQELPQVEEEAPPPPPSSNFDFVITTNNTTDNVVDELKKKIEEIRKRKPGLFKGLEFVRSGEGTGKKKKNAADHVWDLSFQGVNSKATQRKVDLKLDRFEYRAMYKAESRIISTLTNPDSLAIGRSLEDLHKKSTSWWQFITFLKYEDIESIKKDEKEDSILFTIFKEKGSEKLYLHKEDAKKFQTDLMKKLQEVNAESSSGEESSDEESDE